MTTDLHICPHGYDHPVSPADLDYPHSCDGCWCEGARDRRDYGWPHTTEPTFTHPKLPPNSTTRKDSA